MRNEARPWWFIAGHVMFKSGAEAVRAKRETPLFLHQVATSQARAAARPKENAL